MTHSEFPAVEISFSSAESPETVERNTRVVKRDLRTQMTAYGGRVVAAHRPSPPGTRPVDVATIGSVVAHIPVALQAVADMVKVLNAWVTARPQRRVSLTLPDGTTVEIVDPSPLTAAALAEAVIDRLSRPSPTAPS